MFADTLVATTQAWGGVQRAAVIVDEYSQATFVVGLNDASQKEMFNAVKQVVDTIKQQGHHGPFNVTHDKGSELTSTTRRSPDENLSQFERMCADAGIGTTCTNVDRPTNHGQVERRIRLLREGANAALFDSRATNQAWLHAVKLMAITINMNVHFGINDTSPYELITGIKPDPGRLLPFMSTVAIYDEHNEKKHFGQSKLRIAFWLAPRNHARYGALVVALPKQPGGHLEFIRTNDYKVICDDCSDRQSLNYFSF